MTSYNGHSVEYANKIAKEVLNQEFESEREMIDWAMEKNYSTDAIDIMYSAIKYGDKILPFVEKEFYRIGEPKMNYNCYSPSFNFAENKPEEGVSVVTTEWLQSLKSIFFGTDDATLKRRGVYKIKGFVIGFGGDDEPLIYPTDFAEKLTKCNKKTLEKLVKNN